MDLNRAQFIGNLTQNPELRQTASGQNVCSFTVATNRTYTDSAGQKQSQAEFHAIVAWGKLAEIIAQYCVKGKRVYVEGRLQTRSWEDPNGVKHYKTEVVAENLIMLDRAGGPSNNNGTGGDMMSSVTEVPSSPSAMKPSTLPEEEEISIEDVPF